MSRIWTKLPNLRPFEAGVGMFRESCLIAVSVPGLSYKNLAFVKVYKQLW